MGLRTYIVRLGIDTMTTLIVPTRERTDILDRFLLSLSETDPKPRQTIIVSDNCPATTAWLQAQSSPLLTPVINDHVLGFWQSINKVLATLPDDEPFCYFGKDVVFDRDWLTHAEACFKNRYPTGLGLISFRDDVVNQDNASHGMTTKRWLWVLYGHPHISPDYFHWHCDSELTVRSRDLGRYTYCEASHVAHKHEPTGHIGIPNQPNDYNVQNAHHYQWVGGGRREAQSRLGQIN